MRLTSKGQVTIPIEFRHQLGLHPGSEVEFSLERDALRIRRSRESQSRGVRLVEQMRGRGDGTMTTDEIMALTRDE